MSKNMGWLKSQISMLALAAVIVPASVMPAQANSVWNYIKGSASDAEERASGAVDTNDSIIELGYERGRQTVGLRYTLNVPKGSRINSAKLLMQAAKSATGSTSLLIRAQDTDNAAAFSQSTRNISGRTKTSASVKWSPVATKVNAALTSPNIASVVQEVVNRKGFDSGNEVAIIISTTGGTGVRPVHSLDGSGKAPILIVDYTPGKGADKPTTPSKNPTTPKPPKGNDGGSEEVPLPDDTDLTPSSGSGITPGMMNALLKALNSKAVTIMQRNAANPTNAWSDTTGHAKSCDTYRMGRMLNSDVSAMQMAWRRTGDSRYIAEIDRLLQIVRGCLGDSNRDGFRNFVFKKAEGEFNGKVYVGGDDAVMDEQLLHGFLASAAWDLKRSGNKTYGEHARFWTDYLKNDFEAKWRKRKGVKPGNMKFLEYWLFHPYNHFTRYYYSMAKLTGNNAYMVEAKERAAKIHNHFKVIKTSKGDTYGWSHKVGQKDGGCAPTPYVTFAVAGMADLHDKGLISDADMKKVALGLSQNFFRNDGTVAANSCGRAPYTVTHTMRDKNGRIYKKQTTYGGGSYVKDADNTVAAVARFDPSGDLGRKMLNVWNKVTNNGKNLPRAQGLAIGLVAGSK